MTYANRKGARGGLVTKGELGHRRRFPVGFVLRPFGLVHASKHVSAHLWLNPPRIHVQCRIDVDYNSNVKLGLLHSVTPHS
jgi:hypothetical protein